MNDSRPDEKPDGPGSRVSPAETIPYAFERVEPEVLCERAEALNARMQRRRTIRDFSSEPVPRQAIERAIQIASSAPSGAHRQPWTFVVVTDPKLKQRIREAAEAEEREFYAHRAPQDWLDALAPLGTDEVKTHLTDAPYLVVLFKHSYALGPDGAKSKTYYASESCGIAAGFFISALHQMGLATLTHTPSPMGFLAKVLERPANEQAFLLLPVGYPAEGARVPDLGRKPLRDVSVWL